jgi:hypothetical protein
MNQKPATAALDRDTTYEAIKNLLLSGLVGEQRTVDARAWERALEQHGILVRASGTGTLRLVTHRHMEDEHTEFAIGAIARIRDA